MIPRPINAMRNPAKATPSDSVIEPVQDNQLTILLPYIQKCAEGHGPLGACCFLRKKGRGPLETVAFLAPLILPQKVFKNLSGDLHHVLVGGDRQLRFVSYWENKPLDKDCSAVSNHDSGAEALTTTPRRKVRDDIHLVK